MVFAATGTPTAGPDCRPLERNGLSAPQDDRRANEVIAGWVARRPDQVALRMVDQTGTQEWTYRGLWERVCRIRDGAFGDLPVGSRVVMAQAGDADYVAGFLAALEAGLVPVPLYLPSAHAPQRFLRRAQHILRDCEPAAIYTSADLVDVLAREGVPGGLPLRTPDFTAASPRRPRGAADATGEIAFLQYSSGSTGAPKGIVNTHRSMLHQRTIGLALWNRAEDIRTVSWLPLYHDLGIFWGVLLALATGGTATVIPPFDFVRNPRIWLQTVTAVRGNWIAGPDFAYRLCIDAFDDATISSLDLSCLQLAVNGAEPVRPVTLRDFVAKFEPAGLRADVMAPQYGLAEAGLAVSGTTTPRMWVQSAFDAGQLNRGRAVKITGENPSGRSTRTLVSCGDSTLGWDVRIVDPERRVVMPDGQAGEIWVGGTGLPSGYWRQPDQTTAAFEATTADGEGPYLRTGDAGFRCDGELYICGRYRDLIIVGGGNYFPNDIELTVEESGCSVGSGGACAVQPDTAADQWWLVLETDSPAEDLDDLSRILHRRILAAHQIAPSRIVWVRPRVLPRTTSGKIRRRKTLDLLGGQNLSVVKEFPAQPVPAAAATELAGCVAGLLGLQFDELGGDTDLVTLGMTSVLTAQVVEWSATRLRHLDFADLYAVPTLDNWQRLYDNASPARPSAPAGPDGPMTPLQRAYWIGRGAGQPLGAVGCQTYFELAGAAIEPARLSAALDAVALRHPMLRSMFPDAEDFRVATRGIHAPLRVHDLSAVTDAARDRHLGEVRARLRMHRFGIETGDTWRVELTRLADRCILHFAIDLIVADVTSIGILLRDLAALYRGDELPHAAAGFRAAAPVPLTGDVELLPEGPQLPRVDETEVVFRREQRALDAASMACLDKACRGYGVTRAAVFLTAYALVLQRWSTSRDFSITVTTFGRPPGTADVIGDFTKTHLYQAGLDEPGAFAEQVRGAQQGLRVALAAPESTRVLAAQLQAGTGHSGIVPVVFTYAADITVLARRDAETLGKVREVTSMTPQVIIDNQVGSVDGGLIVSWDYRASCFPAGVVTDMFAAYIDLLEGLGAHDWNLPVPIDLPRHSRSIRRQRNDTAALKPPGLLYDAFREHARRNPTRVALRWASDEFDSAGGGDPIAAVNSQLTYGALDDQARRVAGVLAARHEPGSIIGIQLPKGPAQVVAVLGVLMAGCAFLPVGVDQPAKRFARMCALSGMTGLIGSGHNAGADGPVVHDIESMLRCDPVDPVATQPDSTAYIIYTSGSTGEPKGVLVSHAAALNTVVDVNRRNGVGSSDVLLALSALDFDLSVYDVFGPLSCGAGLVMISERSRRDAFRWNALIAEFTVTVWNSVPPLLDMALIAAGDKPASLVSLRSVFLSGDWIPLDLPARLHTAAPDARLVAMGGATEAAIWSNEYVVRDVDPAWQSVPYGYPLSNQMFRVVDELGRDRPDFVAGEMWIGGAGVAQGYHHAPELTAERFVVDESGRRWYRTGDLGCYWTDGTLQFLGRADSQVKVGGHRVECGEIEHVLREHPRVAAAAVVPIRGNRVLGAVVVGDCDAAGLHAHLAARLPQYMIPKSFVVRSALPLTANGKVDRRAAATDIEACAPAAWQPAGVLTPVEQLVAAAWSDVLATPITSRDDNFFAHGGDSLRATRVAVELKRKGVRGAEVGQLLSRQTLGEFSSVCVVGDLPGELPDHAVATCDTTFPLTRLQQAYVLGSSGLAGTTCAPTYFALILAADSPGGSIDVERFAAVVGRCVAEFAVLRCGLDSDTDQRVSADTGPIAVTTIAGTDPELLMQRMAGAGFDPRAVPVIQCFALTGTSRYIGLLINYLSLDARSLATVVATIVADYQQSPRPRQVEGRVDVFARFAAERHHNGCSREYSAPPALPVRDRHTEAATRVGFARSSFTLDPREFGCLRERAAQLCVTPTALIFEAFGQALYSMGAGVRFAVVVPVSHRPDYAPADREVLGNFTRLSLCDIDYGAARPGSPAAVIAAQEQLWHAVGDTGDATGYLAASRMAGSPGYPVVFTSTLGLVPQGPAELSSIRTLTQTPGVWLDCQVEDDGAGARISWDVACGLLADEPVAAAFAHFERAVRSGQAVGFDPPPGDWAGAVVAAAARRCTPDSVRPEYSALVRHWQQLPGTAAAPRDTDRAARRLADIVTGAASPHTLIGDPQLAPEALLLADERLRRALDDLSERVFAHSRHAGRRLRIIELGSRTGLITQRLTGLVGAVVEEYVCFEPNPVLAEIAAGRDIKTPIRQINSAQQIAAAEVDVVVCCGSLHQLADADVVLDRVRVLEGGWLWVAEICEITPATLASAAVLQPDLLSAGSLPAADQWWRFVAERHWQPVQMTQDGPGLTIIAHRPRSLPNLHTAPHPPMATSVVQPVPNVDESVLATIAGIWQRHLNIDRPTPADDFFLLGGDSLVATRVYADLRAAGFGRLSLVDLFNYPVLGELVAHAGTPTAPQSAPAVIERCADTEFPLTVVQQAYLAGRHGGFLLSGVAAHCYFEFEAPDFDRARFEVAARQLVERHPGLRTTVTFADPSRWRALVHPAPIEPVVSEYRDVRQRMRDQVIDVTTRPGIDFGVQPSDGGPAVVGISMDNVMLDGASMMIALAELDFLYRGGKAGELPELRTSFADYVRSRPESTPDADESALPQLAVSRDYWRARLPSLPAAPPLAELEVMLDIDKPVFERVQAVVAADDWASITRLCRIERVTASSFLLANYVRALAQWAGVDHFCVNVTLFDRDPGVPGIADVIGDFTSLLLLECCADANVSIWEQARRLQRQLITDLPHRAADAVWLQRELLRHHGRPARAVFPVVFTSGLGLIDASRATSFEFGRLVFGLSQTPQTVLDFQMWENAGSLSLSWDFVTQAIAPAVARRHLDSMVGAMLATLLPGAAPQRDPVDEIAGEVLRVCATALGVPRVDLRDNFFQLGGDSVTATRVVQQLSREVSAGATLRLLFENPVIGEFAAQLRTEARRTGADPDFEEGVL